MVKSVGGAIIANTLRRAVAEFQFWVVKNSLVALLVCASRKHVGVLCRLVRQTRLVEPVTKPAVERLSVWAGEKVCVCTHFRM